MPKPILLRCLLLVGGLALTGCDSPSDADGQDEAPDEPGQVVYVSPEGDDQGTGGADSPLASIQAAVSRVEPGGEVRVRKGVYAERLKIREGGEPGRPIRVVGEPGAVIDGSLAVEPAWERADEVGPGVWGTRVPFDPRCVTVNGQFLTLLNQDRVTESGGASEA